MAHRPPTRGRILSTNNRTFESKCWQLEFDILYGEGISKTGEILDLGVKGGIVEKSGSWFSYNSERIGQGRENVRRFLLDNPDIANEIEAKVRANSGVLADEMLTGPEDENDLGDGDEAAAG